MDDLDLNIENYNLRDLLNLFKVDHDFDKDNLKKAKRMVLMMHPDKSKLDKKYFLFFSKAYKRLFFIYDFKQTQNTDFNIEYVDVMKKYYETYNDQHDIAHDSIDKAFSSEDYNKFNIKFNKLFEDNRLKNDYQDTGYSEWLKSEGNETLLSLNQQNMNKDDQQRLLNQYKRDNRQLIKHEGIQEVESSSGFSNIVSSAPDNYSSDVFSKLQFEDLKQAHDEPLIMVGEHDARSNVFNSITHLKEHRSSQDTNPLSLDQSKNMLKNRENDTSRETTERAFYLAQEAQEANDIHQKFKKHFNLLE